MKRAKELFDAYSHSALSNDAFRILNVDSLDRVLKEHDKEIVEMIDDMIEDNRKKARDANKLQDYIEAEIYNQRAIALTELENNIKE